MNSELKSALMEMFKDKEFVSSLLQNPENQKRKEPVQATPSPVRLKKVRLSRNDILPSRGECSAGTPAEVENSLEPEYGARDSPDSDHEDIDILEQILANSQEDIFDEPEEESKQSDNSSDSDFEVIGGPPEAAWTISQKVMKWFLTVADIELKKDDFEELKKRYKPSEENASHFEPPKLPAGIWQTITQSNHADAYKLKHIHRAQDSIYLALCPLLSVLQKVDRSTRAELTTAVQLIAHSNLLLNRYRRASLIPHVKKDLRKQMQNLPIGHNTLFPNDFEKSTDSMLKEQAVLNKVLMPKKPPVQQRLGKKNTNQKTYSSNYTYGNFRGRGRYGKNFRGASRGRGQAYQKPSYSSGSATEAAGSSSGIAPTQSA